MDLYLPIAEISVNFVVIVLLGVGVGFLSGMFGVGGGFLTTPLLILYGIPPAVAVASAASQVTGSSVSAALSYWRQNRIDLKMGGVLIAGGVAGAGAGSWLFAVLTQAGQIDVAIGLIYVALLGAVGMLMLREGLRDLAAVRAGASPPTRMRGHNPLIAALPWRTRFYRSGLYISPLGPLALGFAVGVLTMLIGVGGGFLMVPAMLYLLGMAATVVVGTSLFHIVFTTAAATMLHAVGSQTVDVVLAALLLVGGVVGAQLGVRTAATLPPERTRLLLAAIVLAVAIRLGVGLTWQPAELYTVFAGA